MEARAFVRDAVEYIAAAQAIDDSIGGESGFEILSPKVAYYNAYHGIELAAKAMLVHAGWTESQLRDVGHQLSDAIAAAQKHGLNASLTTDELRLIDLLDQHYLRLRYPRSGKVELPIWGPLTGIMIKVLKGAMAAIPGSENAIRAEALDRMTGFPDWHA